MSLCCQCLDLIGRSNFTPPHSNLEIKWGIQKLIAFLNDKSPFDIAQYYLCKICHHTLICGECEPEEPYDATNDVWVCHDI